MFFNSPVTEIGNLYHVNNLPYEFNYIFNKTKIQLIRHNKVLKILVFNSALLHNESKYFLKEFIEDVLVMTQILFSFICVYPFFNSVSMIIKWLKCANNYKRIKMNWLIFICSV